MISGFIGHFLFHITDVELYGDNSPTSATGRNPLYKGSVISILLLTAPTVMAFHDCPGFSTLCKTFDSGYLISDNSSGYTFPALIKNNLFSLFSFAPEVILSIAADHDVGLPSL